MTKSYKQSTRDTSHDDKAALKELQRSVSNLTSPKHEDHGAKFRAMSVKAKDSGPGNSQP